MQEIRQRLLPDSLSLLEMPVLMARKNGVGREEIVPKFSPERRNDPDV